MSERESTSCGGRDSTKKGEPSPVGKRFFALCDEYRMEHKGQVGVPLDIQEKFWKQAREDVAQTLQTTQVS